MDYRDVLERAAATFLQAFLSVFAVADLSSAKSAAVAGVAAVLSLIKGIAASRFGDGSPSAIT